MEENIVQPLTPIVVATDSSGSVGRKVCLLAGIIILRQSLHPRLDVRPAICIRPVEAEIRTAEDHVARMLCLGLAA